MPHNKVGGASQWRKVCRRCTDEEEGKSPATSEGGKDRVEAHRVVKLQGPDEKRMKKIDFPDSLLCEHIKTKKCHLD
jgi:hypothetical protein